MLAKRKILLIPFIVLMVALFLLTSCAKTEGPSDNADPRRKYEGTTLTLLLKEGYEIDVIQANVEDFEEATDRCKH